ncbi:hypothetical protein SISSUDRAFT_1050231 [Sistotremastrum suecicum HHB10207 ss-3]|uniref:Uncharacterized protein n=1 Tax=Sistotremastrum suecicum HHB10207 ss-3 TaxID=1314776 RepID=A0A166BC32_9AGAM|nr:hypothetical protein SISSUDRAFT_1050231 [Sistotremastrum suecicum HHB10207 ss-3]
MDRLFSRSAPFSWPVRGSNNFACQSTRSLEGSGNDGSLSHPHRDWALRAPGDSRDLTRTLYRCGQQRPGQGFSVGSPIYMLELLMLHSEQRAGSPEWEQKLGGRIMSSRRVVVRGEGPGGSTAAKVKRLFVEYGSGRPLSTLNPLKAMEVFFTSLSLETPALKLAFLRVGMPLPYERSKKSGGQ